MLGVFEVRWAPAAAGKKRKLVATMVKQGLTRVVVKRRYQRDLMRCQFQRKMVFLENSRIAPAFGPVELGYQRITVFKSHLVDPVLVTVQGQ